MYNSVPATAGDAISRTIGNGTVQSTSRADQLDPSASDSEETSWFAEMAQGMLGKDAGLALHYLTGFPESSCYKYTAATGARKPPGHLIVTILRSPQGGTWLDVFMRGSDAAWWRDYQRDKSQAAAARAFIRGMDSM